jgi:hypothetical protein
LVVNGGGDQAEIVTKQQAVKSKRNRSMMKKCVNNNDGTWKLMPSVAGGGNDRYRWFNIGVRLIVGIIIITKKEGK